MILNFESAAVLTGSHFCILNADQIFAHMMVETHMVHTVPSNLKSKEKINYFRFDFEIGLDVRIIDLNN